MPGFDSRSSFALLLAKLTQRGVSLDYLVFILGMVIGQFLNWLIDAFSPGKPVVTPDASPARKPSWWRRLPVVDAWFRPGLVKAESWRLFGVELFSGVGFLLAYLKYGFSPEWGVFVFYLCLMLVIALIDIRERLILNRLVVPALPLALLLATFFPMGLALEKASVAPTNNLLFSLLGGAVAFFILLLPAIIKPGGMGFGDVKLAGLVGLATGFPGCLIAIGLAIIGGGLLAIFLLVSRRRGRRDAIAFGPFICAGMLAALVWGVQITDWYLGLIY
jgi:leader peptidase (prepilin peptidase) / N-methyltransferase